eukprot:Clim_evm29s22 gene=Clim_evmTU29s22
MHWMTMGDGVEMRARHPLAKVRVADDVLKFLADLYAKEVDTFCFKRTLESLAHQPTLSSLRVNPSSAKNVDEVLAAINCLPRATSIQPKVGKSVITTKWEPHPILPYTLVAPTSYRSETELEPLDEFHRVFVDHRCGRSVLRGSHIYARGILGMTQAVESGDRVSVYVDVSGKMLRAARKVAEAIEQPIFIGNGTALVGREDVFGRDEDGQEPNWRGVGVVMQEVFYSSPSFDHFFPAEEAAEGVERSTTDEEIEVDVTKMVYPQNIPSIAAVYELQLDRPDLRVADLCCGPGGKTTAIASILKRIRDDSREGDTGRAHWQPLVGVERSKKRAQYVRNLLGQFDLNLPELVDVRTGDVLKWKTDEVFDRILVDAPCSALGQRPEIRTGVTLNDVSRNGDYQRKILEAAFKRLTSGGTLVYSTCTINPLENEAVIAACHQRLFREGFRLKAPKYRLAGPGMQSYLGDEVPADMVQRFEPGREDESIGFFIAVITKHA